MTKRTDPHRPGAIIPADYSYRCSYALATTVEGWPVPSWNIDLVVEIQAAARVAGQRIFGAPGKCGSCGAVYTYGDLWQHGPSGDLLHVGHVCADKYTLMADRSAFELAMDRRNAAAAREIASRDRAERREAFYAENPGLREALELDHPILQDLASKVGKWGLSPKQIALALKIADEVRNPKAAEVHVDAPEGKVTFRGQIVSVKHQESAYGTTIKATIKVQTEAGSWLVWGTCPQAIIDQSHEAWRKALNGAQAHPDGVFAAMRGQEVEITATLRRGRDSYFALMTRPRGSLVQVAA